jgi:hypothetical protein
MSLTTDTNGDDEETQYVLAKKIYEGTKYDFQQQLLSTLVFFEHQVHGSSASRYTKCIEIVSHASNVVNQAAHGNKEDAIDDKSNMEASRLYLCSEKIFKFAIYLEEKKCGKTQRRLSRPEGGSYAQILMINYILPRIVVCKKNGLLQVEWSPLSVLTYINVCMPAYIYACICSHIYTCMCI